MGNRGIVVAAFIGMLIVCGCQNNHESKVEPSLLDSSQQTIALNDISSLNGNSGWGVNTNPDPDSMIGQKAILHTLDGGQSWTDVTPKETINEGHLSGWFFDKEVARAVIGKKIYTTSDSGTTWSSSSIANPGKKSYLDFIDSKNGWILNVTGSGVGSKSSEIYMTNDGGSTWIDRSVANLISGFLPNNIKFQSQKTGWIFGSENNQSGVIINEVTKDGGNTWSKQIVNLPKELSNSVGVTDQMIFDGNGSAIMSVLVQPESKTLFYSSANDGDDWSTVGEVPTATEADFVNLKTGWCWGSEGELYKTVDGGVNWAKINLEKRVTNINFQDEKRGWGISDDGSIVRSSDGGLTWT